MGVGSKKLAFAQAPLVAVTEYVCQHSDYSQQLYLTLKPKLEKDRRLREFYSKIELPLVSTLSQMEIWGILVDVEELQKMSAEYEKRIEYLTQTIREEAGDPELNINSNQQVILMDLH